MGVYERLRRQLDRAGVRPSTRRGQNFLLDNNQLGFIADTGRLSPFDVILEVGPGTGLLTKYLARSGALVLAVELDYGLLPIAREETEKYPNVFYIEGDILAGKNRINPDVTARLEELVKVKADLLRAEVGEEKAIPRLKCVSNLPYSAGTPLIMNLLSSPLPWKNGAFLLQKEVAERIVAPAGGEDYGTLSIASTLAATAKIERVVPPGAFWPRPKVDSAVLSMEFKPVGERLALPWKNMRAVTNAVFGSRRKILKNALKGLFPEGNAAEKLVGLGIDPEGRGENLHPCEFLAIARLTGENAGDEPE